MSEQEARDGGDAREAPDDVAAADGEKGQGAPAQKDPPAAPQGGRSGGDGSPRRAPVNLDSGIDRLERRRHEKDEARAEGALRGQRARGWTERLLTRTTSGAIYAIITTACIFAGSVATALVVAAMAWLCCSEFYRMARMSGRMPNEVLGLTAAIAYPLVALLGSPLAIITVGFLLLISVAVWYVLTPRSVLGDVAITFFGPIYTSLPLSCLVMMRVLLPAGLEGAWFVFWAVMSIWANDAGAYFVGSRFGAHKLAPRISPHKTWEGLAGGLAVSVAIWLGMGICGLCGLTPWFGAVTGLFVGAAGVVGDLFESRIKRGVGVKDSGNVMPGHGGLLDRSDSLLFGMMVALFLLLLGGVL